MKKSEPENKKSITISDVAEALGISKTTVSRAISGKGRIGEETRNKVLKFIEDNNYKPNPMAKGLAEQKNYNICWAIPGNSNTSDLPFFQRCMAGVCEVSMETDYDVLISMVYEDNISQLKRIVDNKKADGVILARTLVDDQSVRFMKERGIPFVVIGSTSETNVIQIDNDHINACRELTSSIIRMGKKRVALIGGSMNHVVNRTRQKGYEEGLIHEGLKVDESLIFPNNETAEEIEDSVEKALDAGADCIICMDDRICHLALTKLKKKGISIPGDVGIASFYNSDILSNNQPAITTLEYDPKELGNVACSTLLKLIAGETVEEKNVLGYKVLLKNSI